MGALHGLPSPTVNPDTCSSHLPHQNVQVLQDLGWSNLGRQRPVLAASEEQHAKSVVAEKKSNNAFTEVA